MRNQDIVKKPPLLWFLFLGAIIFAVLGLYFSTPPQDNLSSNPVKDDESLAQLSNFQKMLESGGSGILVSQQTPGDSVLIDLVSVTSPSFVVIYNDDNGMPGEIIGSSSLINDAAENFVVPLSEPTQGSQLYYAVVHEDKNLDGQFSAATDFHLKDDQENIIIMSFTTK